MTSDSTGGVFSGVLERRVSCARWDPGMLDVSILWFWGDILGSSLWTDIVWLPNVRVQ